MPISGSVTVRELQGFRCAACTRTRANTEAGHRNVTHGCVGLATDGTARRFYDQVLVGDVVTVTGSAKDTVAAGNGYGDWNLTWNQWLAHSAAGVTTTV
ncbi:L,D-transpeptidase family protein [Streptomyces hygroscopicus]|uniref:L,D-transpeptidase family protein n=1 Tax=Streptomyces hygroscopicus TaxID=1912 RepID=UPI00223EB9AD|nr:L,D-transpeptidase [Streptomyces hygroscopicus]